MNLFILTEKQTSIKDFIAFWSTNFYEPDENNDEKYISSLQSINKLTEENILKLFEWKNGMRLSDKKKESIKKIIDKLADIEKEFINSGDSALELEKIYEYSRQNFFNYGHIWNLFFLHILKPESCPIADKYAYRAFNFICYSENKIPDNWEKLNFYLEYKNFFNKIASDTNRRKLKERKEIDEALWGFGKFLERYQKII